MEGLASAPTGGYPDRVPQRIPLDVTWMDDATCRGIPDIMFPPEHTANRNLAAAYDRARDICAICPVQPDCLEWALLHPDAIVGGVVAGLDPKQLVEARRERLEERRANATPKCGTERAYVVHAERGEHCELCIDVHARKGHRYAEAS